MSRKEAEQDQKMNYLFNTTYRIPIREGDKYV
jgi:hypothetical protein